MARIVSLDFQLIVHLQRRGLTSGLWAALVRGQGGGVYGHESMTSFKPFTMPVFFHMQHPILVRSNRTLEMGQWDGNRRNNSLQKQTQGTWGFQAQALKELFLTH